MPAKRDSTIRASISPTSSMPRPRRSRAVPVTNAVDRQPFMFAVGIECSYPLVDNGIRVDQLEATGHYEHWRKDLSLVINLGIRYLRYGPPLHRIWTGPNQYDWSWIDLVMAEMQRLGIEPIIDLLHFGLPDWIGHRDPERPWFQLPDWPQHFADYASAFAARYPHVRYYTPVNEIYVTALFSGLYGWWNEQLRSDEAFVTNLKHCVRASILAMRRILDIKPHAVFVFSESTEYVHPGSPELVEQAQLMNERRFLSLDLLYGHDISAKMYRYLTTLGRTTDSEYMWFMNQRDLVSHCILGTDYYVTNEHVIHPEGRSTRVGELYGYYVITRQYYERYRLPVMHTETNRATGQAVEWLWKEWVNLLRLREDGIPIVGFTWYGLVDMKDWDSALTHPRGRINAVGLFDLRRRPRPVARAYRELIEQYSHLNMSRSKLPILLA